MSGAPTSAEWRTSRGEKWLAHIAGMEAMLAPLVEPLVEAARLDAPARIADVGCGGGAVALELARRAPRGSAIHGFDISPKLVAHARARVGAADPSIRFDVADVSATTPPERYGRLVSRLGSMFFDDPPAAFANLAAWLEPGGRAAFAVWGLPAENVWSALAREVVGAIVALPEPDPDGPGPFRYARPASLPALLESAGFDELAVRDWRGELAMGGGLPADRAAVFALSAFSGLSELLARAGEDAAREARRALTAAFSEHEASGAVRLAASVRVVTGVRR
jgi:SAM-dependent methyltransferase